MKKRKLNKKRVIIVSIILVVILIEIINPIKLYNKHLLKELGYNDTSVNVILKECPKIVEDSNFFNRLTHILSLNSKVEMSNDYAKTHNKLLKKIYKTAKKYR